MHRLCRELLRACRGLAELSLLRHVDVLVERIIGADAEFRLLIKVGQRRDGPGPLRLQIRAAEHHGRIVRRTIGMVRTVTRHASDLARRRQARVKKQVPAKLSHGGERLNGRTIEMNWVWVLAGQTFRFGGEDGAGQKAGAEEPHDGAIEHTY